MSSSNRRAFVRYSTAAAALAAFGVSGRANEGPQPPVEIEPQFEGVQILS